MVQHHYGVWLFQSAAPLSDPRLWRESVDGQPAPTRFARALHIRRSSACGLAYRGCFGELSAAPSSVPSLLRELFGSGLVSVAPALPEERLVAELRGATG